MASVCQLSNLPEIPDHPHQPGPGGIQVPQAFLWKKERCCIMPATNATSERFFSAFRRVKNYLRGTMTQQRLNNLMVLHVHKDITDSLKLQDIANEFVGISKHRLKLSSRLYRTSDYVF